MSESRGSAKLDHDVIAPGQGHRLARWIFLRGLGVVYLCAIVSLWIQMTGLFGQEGIMPADLYMDRLASAVSEREALSWWQFPTLFWFLGAHDGALHSVAGLGVALSIGLILGYFPRLMIACLWVIYLSFFTVGSPFLNYQWDILLLEVSVVAFLYAPATLIPDLSKEREPSVMAHWLLRLVIFKLIWSSGVVKLNSQDPSWQDLTALNYHYWTQPIPHQIAWYAHNAANIVREAGVVFNHYVELFLPWLFLWSPTGRHLLIWLGLSVLTLWFGLGDLALWHSLLVGVFALGLWWMSQRDESSGHTLWVPVIGVLILMLGVFTTGNYGFFNLLTVVFAIGCLTDRNLYWVTPNGLLDKIPSVTASSRRCAPVWSLIVIAFVCVLFPLNALRLASLTSGSSIRDAQRRVEANEGDFTDALLERVGALDRRSREAIGSYALVNGYGLFARMTKERIELIIEGSSDGEQWKPYRFNYKPNGPGDLHFAGLHMPRLDWQMWFAALYPRCSRPWFFGLLDGLFSNSPAVLSLLETNPFQEGPPTYIRVRRMQATFTSSAEGETEQGPWVFREAGDYCPVIQASDLEKAARHRRR